MLLSQLYRVLSKKRDPLSHVLFLDAVSSTVGADFLEDFWVKTSQVCLIKEGVRA